jgi:hypothetical protein
MCLALRDDHGQVARVVTNYDGLVISALVEAQAGLERRTAGPCPLRGMRTASVSSGAGARLAASASLVLASAKVRDHVVDGDGPRVLAAASRRMASRWARQSSLTGQDIGFDTGVVLDAVGRQASVESGLGLGSPVLVATEPTETATAAVCGHTAVLAGRPENVEPLREVGRLFGRIAHLLDAVEDLEEDAAKGAWNPLTATGTSLTEARRLCDDAVLGTRMALREATFTDDRLVHVLLVHELNQSVIRAFGHSEKPPPDEPRKGLWFWPTIAEPPRSRGFFAGCGAFAYMCCTCQFCCRDPFPGPWSGKRRENHCDCDCDCCDCCSCKKCDCCDCCDCSC